jgi:hypothetical protein
VTQDNQEPTTPDPASEDQAHEADEGDAPREKKGGPERKERVLHTRVPAVLEQELKRLATSLRMPVSNVVRAILEDAVTAVDLVGRKAEGEMQSVVDRLSAQRERLRNIATGAVHAGAAKESKDVEPTVDDTPTEARVASSDKASAVNDVDILAGILGFQPLVLAAAASCALCGKSLAVGQQAFLGVREGTGPRVLIGSECLPTHPSDKEIES